MEERRSRRERLYPQAHTSEPIIRMTSGRMTEDQMEFLKLVRLGAAEIKLQQRQQRINK